MQTAIIQAGSEKDFSQITELVQKLGLKMRVLSTSEQEDFALGLAITEGKSGSYVNTDSFLAKLKDESPD